MAIDETHDAARRSWVELSNQPGGDFPIQNLPLCIFSSDGRSARGGIGIGDQVFDLAAARELGLFSGMAEKAAEAASGATLNALMALGPQYSSALRLAVCDLLTAGASGERARALRDQILVPMAQARFELPAFIRSYTDFTCSVDHTRRRQGKVPDVLMRLPVAYHGRSSSIRLDGTPVRRPIGQYKADDETIAYGPEPRLDFELEFAALVGQGNTLGEPVPIGEAAEHIFGYVLLNDWSARGIQHHEMMLGPFLGKSFLTTISPWIVTQQALAPFRAPAVTRAPSQIAVPPHLLAEADQQQGGIDLELTADLQTQRMHDQGLEPERIVRTNFAEMIWTFGQMLAHHTSNGCNLEPGDLLASGTVSGSAQEARACMGEINERGEASLQLPGGETRMWLEDGDEVTLRARASRSGFVPIGFGRCSGRIEAARGRNLG